MGAAPSRETMEQLLPQVPFYGQRQQVVLIPLISHFFPDADCALFRQLYDTRGDPSVRYYQCVKEIFADAGSTQSGGNNQAAAEHKANTQRTGEEACGADADASTDDDPLVMECEPPECFPGTYFTREALYDAYIRRGPERFVYDTDVEMLSAYQADPLHAVRPIPCAVAFLYHLPNRPAPTASKSATAATTTGATTDPEGDADAEADAAAAAALAEPWLSEGCVEVLGCYIKVTGFVGDVSLLNPNFKVRRESGEKTSATSASPPTTPLADLASAISGGTAETDANKETVPCMELHIYLTKSAGDHNRTHVLLSAMYTYAEQWQRACLHYAAIQEAQCEAKAKAALAEASANGACDATVASTLAVVPEGVRAHTAHVANTAVFNVTRQYSSASSSYYRKFIESKSATVMRSLLSATEAARENQTRAADSPPTSSSASPAADVDADGGGPDAASGATEREDSAQSKVTSHLSGTKRRRAAPETAFLLWAAPPLPAARLHSRRTNVPLLCFLREVRAAFMSMHVCAENLRQLQEVGEDAPLSDNIAVAPATLTCNCVEYEAALDDLVMWLETKSTEVPQHPTAAPTTESEQTNGARHCTEDAAGPPSAPQSHEAGANEDGKRRLREETYLTVFAPSWVVQRLLEHVVDCLLHNLSPLEILKAQRELQHQHQIDPPPPEPTNSTRAAANTTESPEATEAAPIPAPQKTVCHCAMLKRIGKKCIYTPGGPPCCCMSRDVDGKVTRVPCQCSVNHSIGLETKQLRLPDEDIIVEEWPPRVPPFPSDAASSAAAPIPDLRALQMHRADHRLLYLVGEDPARRQSATQCLVDWLAQGHPLTVGSSNSNVEELEITVTLPTRAGEGDNAEPNTTAIGSAASCASGDAQEGGETANKTDAHADRQTCTKVQQDGGEDRATLSCCDCDDCDCEAGDPMTAQAFTIHQLPRMAPLAPFLSTIAHPHPAVWSRRTLEIFRQAAAEHEKRMREKAAREGGEDRSEPAPLLLLRPGTVIELSRVTTPTLSPSSTSTGAPPPPCYREVRISCYPTEELLLAELRFASRKGREGHPDDTHWVRYAPGEAAPPSVPLENDDDAWNRETAAGEEEDEDAVPPRPPGGENIVGDGSSCLWRMDLGEGAERILAVTPYFLKPLRKKHVKKKKAIPKAAAAHGTALNVFFYPLSRDTKTTAARGEESSAAPHVRDGAHTASAEGAAGTDAAHTTKSEGVAYDDEGSPIPTSEKAKKKKKRRKKKSESGATAGEGEEEEVAAEAKAMDADVNDRGVAEQVETTASSALTPPTRGQQETKAVAEAITPATTADEKADQAVYAPSVQAPAPAEPPADATPTAAADSLSPPAPREKLLNSAALPFRSRQSSLGLEPVHSATAQLASHVPLPRSRNTATTSTSRSAAVPGAGVGSGGYEDLYQPNWGYPYGNGGAALAEPTSYSPDPTFMPPPPPGSAMMRSGPALHGAGVGERYHYGAGGAAPGMYSPPLPPPPPPMHPGHPMGLPPPPAPRPYGVAPQDPYCGGYDPRTGQPLPPFPPSDAYGGYYGGAVGPAHGSLSLPPPMPPPPVPTLTSTARNTIPPAPRTRRQVRFDPNGQPIRDDAAHSREGTTTTASHRAGETVANTTAEILAKTAASNDAPPSLSHYHPAPVPSGLPPTNPTTRAPALPNTTSSGGGALFTPVSSPLMDGNGHNTGAHSSYPPYGNSSTSSHSHTALNAVPTEMHVNVRIRHHQHTRTVSYLSESTTNTDLAGGTGMLQFSASHADMMYESPTGTNQSLPAQSPTTATHRRHASFSHLTMGSEAAGVSVPHTGSAHQSGMHAPSVPHPHHQLHHSLSSNPSARAGQTAIASGSLTAGSGCGAAAAAGVEMGSIKSGDTVSTTNTAKRMHASSHTYRWDWRNVTLDMGEDDA